jgi:hypothetical protein
MPGPELARERKDCWGMILHWDGGSDETTVASGGMD